MTYHNIKILLYSLYRLPQLVYQNSNFLALRSNKKKSIQFLQLHTQMQLMLVQAIHLSLTYAWSAVKLRRKPIFVPTVESGRLTRSVQFHACIKLTQSDL